MKKAVAHLRISTSQPAVLSPQLGQLPVLGAGQAAVLAGARIPFRLPDPLPHHGLGQVEVPRDLAHRPVPAWHSSTISALNSGVNAPRCRRGFFPTLSMIGHPSGDNP